MNPEITVLMAVYNGETFLREAIESILNQTLTNFELLIVDDGSTDTSTTILESYQDSRIRVLYNQTNVGLTKALNMGLNHVRGRYVARMDADDISRPERLACQYDFMERNRNVGVCGTYVEMLGNGSVWEVPTGDQEIRASLLFRNTFAHASVLMRACLIKNYEFSYNEDYSCAQDYDMWVRCSQVCKLANLNKVLLCRRNHPDTISCNLATVQIDVAGKVRKKLLQKLGIEPTDSEMRIHNAIGANNCKYDNFSLKCIDQWLRKLQVENRRAKRYVESVFLQTLGAQWYQVCRERQSEGLVTWQMFWRSPFSSYVPLALTRKAGFFIKCCLRMSR